MRNTIAILLLIFVTTNIQSQPLHAKTEHAIIIDTDCAIDDMRALSLLLSRPSITIKAILLSDGSLSPIDGVGKVKSLLKEFNGDSIPVAPGETLNGINPPWREFNKQILWGSVTADHIPSLDAIDCLTQELSKANEKIVLVCLGPLTNIARLLKKDAALLSKIERIIWYNESVKPLKGFNYECDKASADLVFNSGVRIDVISNLKKEDVLFDSTMFSLCKQSKTKLGVVMAYVHNQPLVLEKLKQNHFRLCDELVVLYLTNPELFDINILKELPKVRFNQNYNTQGVIEAMRDMINGNYVSEQNIVFNKFPDQREMFNYDVRQMMDSAISRHGKEEWKANVMTDEFHGHLGVFSIVGAKMGIKARDIFGVGPDVLKVQSYAGSKPPYSCLTDGIQVSTGATLGMGTISLVTDSIAKPSAIFTYKNRSVRLTLKKEYLDKVDADIAEGIIKFGLMDDGYWKLVRRNALKYWLEWDRNVIFSIEEISR